MRNHEAISQVVINETAAAAAANQFFKGLTRSTVLRI